VKCAEISGGERIRTCLYSYYMLTEQMDKVKDLVQVLCPFIIEFAYIHPCLLHIHCVSKMSLFVLTCMN